MTPAAPRRDPIGIGGPGAAIGKPKSFCRPCAMNKKPTTMRRTLNNRTSEATSVSPIAWRSKLSDWRWSPILGTPVPTC